MCFGENSISFTEFLLSTRAVLLTHCVSCCAFTTRTKEEAVSESSCTCATNSNQNHHTPCSSQMITDRSNEQEASTCPNSGCPQTTFHTGPVCPLSWMVCHAAEVIHWPSATSIVHKSTHLQLIRKNPLVIVQIPDSNGMIARASCDALPVEIIRNVMHDLFVLCWEGRPHLHVGWTLGRCVCTLR